MVGARGKGRMSGRAGARGKRRPMMGIWVYIGTMSGFGDGRMVGAMSGFGDGNMGIYRNHVWLWGWAYGRNHV